jgi:hypothetical protein
VYPRAEAGFFGGIGEVDDGRSWHVFQFFQ